MKTRFPILFLLFAPIIAQAQTNCSTGSWTITGDTKAGPQCPTSPSNGYVINLTETVVMNDWCTATADAPQPAGTQYWSYSGSLDVGNGERYCPVFGIGAKDCWPRMWQYETDGGQPYPNGGPVSDIHYNRFFNQGYDHKIDITSSACYEVPPKGYFSSQDFRQCPTLLCIPPPPPPRCCKCPGPNSAKLEGKPQLLNVQTDGCQQGYSQLCCGSTPIIIDTSGNGFQLTSAANGVKFDISGTGTPVQMSWTAANSGNAFLCLPDANGNCDDGRDLFGNQTPQPASATPNGFAALAVYDTAVAGGNGDGVIDSKDPIFNRLRLWIDANHDGVSQPNEIFTLPALGITSISLNYKADQRTDQYGNVFRYRAQAGSTSGAGRIAYDVFFTVLSNGQTITAKFCPAFQSILPEANKIGTPDRK